MFVTTVDQKIAEWFNNLEYNGWSYGNLILCVIAVLLAILYCGILGLEREIKGKGAGLRTHLLVGVGSCIIMIISIYGFPVFTNGADQIISRDVARLAAQVVTGCGFLGAGVIMHRNTGVKGLTTAATVWLAMALGLACGSMNFILATLTLVITMIVLTTFRKLEARVKKKQPGYLIVCKLDKPIMVELNKLITELGGQMHRLNNDLSGDSKYLLLSFTIHFEKMVKAISSLNALMKSMGSSTSLTC